MHDSCEASCDMAGQDSSDSGKCGRRVINFPQGDFDEDVGGSNEAYREVLATAESNHDIPSTPEYAVVREESPVVTHCCELSSFNWETHVGAGYP